MGQKSNPNSFNSNQYFLYQNNFIKNSDYKYLLSEQLNTTYYFSYFFEKQTNSFVSYASYFVDDKNNTLVFVLSFLNLRQKKKDKTPLNDLDTTIKTKLSTIFNRLGYSSLKKIFIFQNLNKIASSKIKPLLKISELSTFKYENYYMPAIYITALSSNLHQTNILIGKFVLKYLRLLHRSKRCNLFFHFLSRWVQVFIKLKLLKGIRIQVKGRFQGDPRSSIKVFQAGQIPLQTIKAKISYSLQHVCTSYGVFGVKVWVYKQ